MFFAKEKEIVTDDKKIDELLSRGVKDVFVMDSLRARLKSGKQLRVKLGFDPTGAQIHLGRAVILRKLREFQQLGHKVVFIIGDYTARIGDPSDKLNKRPMLTADKIEENLKDYKTQVGKILDLKSIEFRRNSEWLKQLGFSEIAELAESFSVQQMSNRRNFKERFEKGEEVSLREFLYPLMQGYDSVAIGADIEIGGFDQLFNLKAGRIIQRHYGKTEQDVLTGKMLPGMDGRKMSTSWGNVVNVVDSQDEMFGKIMSLRDELIGDYFELCTDVAMEEVTLIRKDLAGGLLHPKEAKTRLAFEITGLYHGKEVAEEARDRFREVFQGGGMPEDAPQVKPNDGEDLASLLLRVGIVKSKSDFRRLLNEGALERVGHGNIEDLKAMPVSGSAYKIGKRRFIKII
ncbi:MAG: tyrosine--tRNA ligase [Candidatus Taylorbacteria bacterium RIFCSPLOWO2_12_FULL_47_20]|uniref:Tyrosine--tRNA ligase n=2 Tax=Candidatus Tayloriibacteriota TaxID=1817919 RepID=A0A1G2P774_9BACT|nr:MAG: tyrosine--tRNA ligase [Candidatus Taylorbacteria bacterium RIFCSPLOWO2_02_FULL_46_40]OHA44160.1 MAG: tyrosine--tRNA ligase [Candidatus Taylorbacteria bacterium RIFCSPLOWO2_12_FULL_47_20]